MMLFNKQEMPRRPNFKKMHVKDAGYCDHMGGHVIYFKCVHCGYETGWIPDKWTVTENRKGHPCPKCNTANKQKITTLAE